MKSEQILTRPPRVLSQEQREFYVENGYLLLEGFVSHEFTESNTMKVKWLTGSAGSVTVHHCRAIHGSLPNSSDRCRPLLPQTYAAADALPHTAHEGRLIRGEPARWVEFDSDPCQLPPDRAGQPGVTIFSSQNRERSV
jgi:hypothetical protein